MKKTRKICTVFLAALLLLSAFAFAGCDVNDGPIDQTVDVNLPLDVTGSLKVGVKNESHEIDVMQKFIDSFKVKYPNVTITMEKMNSQDYNQTIIQYYNADKSRPGSMPDVLEFAYEIFPFIESKVVKNIQPYVDASVEKGLLNESDFYGSLWKTGQKNYSGDRYMIPRSYDHTVAYFNKEIFTQAGVSYPENGWTWDDFLTKMLAVRRYWDNHGKSDLFLIDAYLDWEAVYNSIYLSNGVQYFNADNEVTLDSNETRKALGMMKYLMDERIVGPYGGSSSSANFEGGQGAMMFHTNSTRSRWLKALGDKMGVVTFPTIGGSHVNGAGAVGYAIYEKSRNANLAWAFLMHVLSVEGQTAASESGNVVPIRKDMGDPAENIWGQYPKNADGTAAFTLDEQKAFIDNPERDQATSYMVQFDPKFSKRLMDAVKQMGIDVVNLNPKSIDDAVAACVKELNKIISDPY